VIRASLRLVTVGLVSLFALASNSAAAYPASVEIGPKQITVTASGGARVVIARQPFGLSFENAQGQVVLRELATTRIPQVVTPPTQSQFGAIGQPPSTLYAALGFLVGTSTVTQEPAGEWEGDLAATSETGIEYSAQSVLAARAVEGGVVLTVSTNDPTGRTLMVTVSEGKQPDAIEVHATPNSTTGVAAMADSFASSSTEAFHGFGGRHNSLDQRGQDFLNWIEQENVSSGSASSLTAPIAPGGQSFLFPNGPEAAYYVQSSFVSSDGYGFLLDQSELSRWRLDSDRSDAWQTEVAAPGLDYVVVPAAPSDAIHQLTAITGRQPAPPSWAAGSLFDREVKYPSDPASQYAAEVQSDIDNIRRYHLRVDGYRLEGWAELPAATLKRLIDELKAMHIHPLVYFRAFVGTDTTGTDDPSDYQYAIDHGYVATRANGQPYTFISNFNSPAAVIDFSNPAAVRWWDSRITAALNLGADGFMQDFGEQVLADMHFHNGMTGAQMHNLLPILYDRATRQAVDAYEHAHPGRRIFFFTRAGYSGASGAPGDAAYENANFPGDETTDWSTASGLASLTPDMLNRAIGGAFGYSTDIGGYVDLGPYQATTKELFIRWAEWAALSPLFRLHGSLVAGTHTPWSYDSQTVSVYEQLVALHMAARPLILKLWRQADHTGMPITRPLWLAYPNDPEAAQQDQEWLLGPDVLVAPVVSQGATSRQVYFPAGCWVRPDTGQRYEGPRQDSVSAPLSELPYFFRCGSHPFALASTARCPAATGRLVGSRLGPIQLGERRVTVRRALGRLTRHRSDIDSFCLAGGAVRVGYPSARLLHTLRPERRHELRSRVVLILTANPHYAFGRIRPGMRVRTVLRRLHRVHHYRVGRNTWYVVTSDRPTGVLKVQHGRVEEIGIAASALTPTARSVRRFLRSFR
jgi:alpha-glucosidase